MIRRLLLVICVLLILFSHSNAQDIPVSKGERAPISSDFLTGINNRYTSLENQLTRAGSKNSGEYLPHVDSVRTSLLFLQQNNQLLTKSDEIQCKLFKKTKLQLLRHFLSYRQVPASQLIKFRIGYNLK